MVTMALFKVRCYIHSIVNSETWIVLRKFENVCSKLLRTNIPRSRLLSCFKLFPFSLLASRRATVQSLQFARRISPYSCFIYENIKVLCSNFKMESTREEEAKNMKEYHQHNFHKILQQREKGKNIVEELDFMNNQQKEVQHFLNGPLYHVMFMFCTPNGL